MSDAGPPVLVEACVTSVAQGVAAVEAGADRLELCRRLDMGGLTPGLDEVRRLVAAVAVPVMVMIRSREGPFVARPQELAALEVEAERALHAGAAGLVFGFLTDRGSIDRAACDRLARVATGRPVTFHRAFDALSWTAEATGDRAPGSAVAALGELHDLGIERVLTGGGPGAALSQKGVLADLVAHAPPAFTILVGGGVRGGHARRLTRETGATELHARASAIPELVAALS